MTSRRLTPLLVSLLLAGPVSLLAGCGGSGAGPNSLTLYSGQHEQTTSLLVAAFERSTHIKVAVRFGDEAALGNQLLTEGSNSPADVFYSENSPVLESLSEHHMLAPVAPTTLAAVPARYSSAAGRWVGVSARTAALVYDTGQLSSASVPSSLLALGEPAWRGRVGFAPSETDFQPLVTAVIRLEGQTAAERWLKGLQGNAKVYSDNETAVTQVNNGESAIAPINSYYWYRLRAELGAGSVHSALAYFAPHDPGALIDVSGAAVIASSAHKAAAQRFLAFLVSEEGQRTIAHSHSYEYPLRPGIAAAPGLPPLSGLAESSLTPSQLGDGSQALDLEQELGLL